MTDDVELRPLRRSDGSSVIDLCRCREAARFLSMPVTSPAVFRKYYSWVQNQRRRNLCGSFVVTQDDDIVGLMQVRMTHPRVGEIGWILHPRVWGCGIFAPAASMLCDYAYTTMGLQRLEARVAVNNARACRAMSRIGAMKEATLLASLFLGSRHFDEELWAINKRRRPREV